MTAPDRRRIAELCGATAVVGAERIQTVWSGYGELVRYHLVGGPRASVVAKHVRPPKGRGRSHDRKLRSYEVEAAFYRDHAEQCGDACRVARCLHVARDKGQWLFILEDLDAAGFPKRFANPAGKRLDACLRWLAAFHAGFVGKRPRGLWKVGTYWHLRTRPDELRAAPRGPLREAAGAIDAKLNGATWQTWVHGDAKPANFCFTPRGDAVAAVDFQYVGAGVGIKDVAYLLTGADRGTIRRGLDVYFKTLRQHLARGAESGGAESGGATAPDADAPNADAIEAEWRSLYDMAWADFHRFLVGWAPGWRAQANEAEMTRRAVAEL